MTARGEETEVYHLQCIDLSNPDIHESAAILRKACMEAGIFYVINHGISQEFMDETFAEFRRFFHLPIEEKMKLLWNKNLRGFRPPIQAVIDDKTEKTVFSEAFNIGVEASKDDLNAHDVFYGQNIWPPADLLAGWRKAMEKYHQEARNVASAVLRIIAIALDLNEDFFDQPQFLGNAIPILSLIHYDVEGVQPLKECIVGTPPHTDPTLITLLATDDVPGFQVCRNVEGKVPIWEDIAPLKGAFIVNIGDILERMSNCIFRSTLHRVQHQRERYTIALFVYPSPEGTIECIPSCVSAENPPKYPPTKSKELLGAIFKPRDAAP